MLYDKMLQVIYACYHNVRWRSDLLKKYEIKPRPSPAVTVYTRVEASFKPNKMPLKLIE